MKRLSVSCPTCDATPMLLPSAIRVLVVGDRANPQTGSAYHFTCPSCATRVVRDADLRIVGLLEGAGCPVTVTGLEVEVVQVWVGRFACGHDIAGTSAGPPDPGDWRGCDSCGRTRELVDVVVGRKVAA